MDNRSAERIDYDSASSIFAGGMHFLQDAQDHHMQQNAQDMAGWHEANARHEANLNAYTEQGVGRGAGFLPFFGTIGKVLKSAGLFLLKAVVFIAFLLLIAALVEGR